MELMDYNNFDNLNELNRIPDEIISEDDRINLEEGTYLAIMANIVPIYKDAITNEFSEIPKETSHLAFLSQRFILTEYVSPTKLNSKKFIEISDVDYKILVGNTSGKFGFLIYKDFIPIDRKSQWKIYTRYSNKFDPPLYGIKDGKNVTYLSNFLKHFGSQVIITLSSSKKGNKFIKSVVPTGKKFPKELVEDLIDKITTSQETENNEVTPPEELPF